MPLQGDSFFILLCRFYLDLAKSSKLGASLPLPPIAGLFIVSSLHTVLVNKTYADAPNGGYITAHFFHQKIGTALYTYKRPARGQLHFGSIMGLSVRAIVFIQLCVFLLSRSLSR
jgi:hypothetical protein